MHISMDIETLSTKPDATVLSIGAVAFSVQDGLAPVQYYAVIDLEAQDNRSIDPNTVTWWMRQAQENPGATDVFDGTRESVDSALLRLTKYFQAYLGPKDEVWANGPDFDCVIVKTLFDEFNQKAPWRHTQHRCVRSLRALAKKLSLDVQVAENMCAHNALADAEYQAREIIATMKELGVAA